MSYAPSALVIAIVLPVCALLLALWLRSDRHEITRILRHAGHVLASAGPWFVAAMLSWAARGQAPSGAHPAAKALPCQCKGCAGEMSPVDFGLWEREVRSGPHLPAPRGES